MRNVPFWKKYQCGGVAIITAIALPVLLGFAGLALDLGHMYIQKTELQNATDACALAASRELTCDPAAGACPATYLTAATNSGLTAARRNKVDFQANAISDSQITANDVKFSTVFAPNSSYRSIANGASPASKYVMCTAQQSGIVPWFMAVLGIGNQTVAAQAVATLAPAQTNCAIPLGVCMSSTGTPANPYAGLNTGDWMTSKLNSSATGSFDWIDFSPGPGGGGGANELAATLKGTGQCSLPPVGPATCPQGGTPPPGCVGEQGNKNSLGKAWNTRFGLYKGSDSISNAPPDYTGYAYTPTSWPSKSGAFNNFQTARASFTAFQGESAAGLSNNALNGYSTASSTMLSTSGADRRLAVAPIVNCASWLTPNPQYVSILGYACVLILHPMTSDNGPSGTDEVFIEYRGKSTDPASPCATSGSVGGPGSVGPLVPSLVQ